MPSTSTQRNGRSSTATQRPTQRERPAEQRDRPQGSDGRSRDGGEGRQQKSDQEKEPGGIRGWIAGRAGQWSVDDADPEFAHRQRYLWNLVIDHYFRMETEGWHRLPPPPALLVGIHSGGILPMDAWMLGFEWWRRFGGDRIVHGTAHDGLMAAPGLGAYFRRMGVLPASPKSIAAALEAGHDVSIYPGGDVDALRPWTQRDKVVLGGRTGFVKMAITAGVPIVPVATVGGADTVVMLTNGRGLAKRLRLDKLARAEALPIALGLPYGLAPGILPFFPMPAKIRTEILDPVELDTDPERAEDDRYVERMYHEVERRLQRGVRRLAKRRSFPLLG